MIDYRRLYFTLFNAITDALEAPDFTQAKSILMEAQQESEEQYLVFDEAEAVKDCFEEVERLRTALFDYIDSNTAETINATHVKKLLDAIDEATEYCRENEAQN
ncbi:MAG: hypothetical protein IJZ66_00665 [Oscillibacter sp.]|nr:hypothetical protein [Oscillibacter sp.]MBQ8850945.1 hypothetical protein [Oscillibacter sp.]